MLAKDPLFKVMREKSHLLSEKNPKNRYMSFVVEKK
jgi:hypothetical protein